MNESFRVGVSIPSSIGLRLEFVPIPSKCIDSFTWNDVFSVYIKHISEAGPEAL
jgi:hypothetical protein